MDRVTKQAGRAEMRRVPGGERRPPVPESAVPGAGVPGSGVPGARVPGAGMPGSVPDLAAIGLSPDRLFSRTMVDAGRLAQHNERVARRLAAAAERFGYDHGVRLQGQLRSLGRVGDRVCAWAFGPGMLPLDARDYTLVVVARTLRNTAPLAAPLAVSTLAASTLASQPHGDNGFLLAERIVSDLVNQALDLQHDVVGVWLDIGREVIEACPFVWPPFWPGFGPAAGRSQREDGRD
ncbi:hypothetical protein [Rhodoplanes azumiensis]|uniref:Uncharacterized protein n=1 Tax=Rhodoplanes azumiensis TaxID=1897628 RepID=A0ABW5AGF5_9BRAD